MRERLDDALWPFDDGTFDEDDVAIALVEKAVGGLVDLKQFEGCSWYNRASRIFDSSLLTLKLVPIGALKMVRLDSDGSAATSERRNFEGRMCSMLRLQRTSGRSNLL